LVPFSRPSFWLVAARKLPLLLLRLLLRLLPRLLLRLLTPLLRLLLRLPRLRPRFRLLLRKPPRSNLGNEIGSAKPAQVVSGLPGFSISGYSLNASQRTHYRQQRIGSALD